VRKQDVQERFCDLGKFVVEFKTYAGGEERKRLDHALDVWVLYLLFIEKQASGNLGITASEVCPHPTEEDEFAFVIF
jgi:hypothetical protein